MKKKAVDKSEINSSREKLVYCAEALFAERGFDGVSVRDITNAAGVNSALVGYYFRNKEGLLSEIYTRHCKALNLGRKKLLAEFSETAGGLTLEKVIEAFIGPALEVTTSRNGRSGYTRLRAILSAENSTLLEKLVAENFDASSRMFVKALGRCLPGLSRDELLWRFHFLLGTISYTGTGPNRIRALSDGRCDPTDPQAMKKRLVPFLAAGFRAPNNQRTSGRKLKRSRPHG
jgi:AcrR family transcriptional regulator